MRLTGERAIREYLGWNRSKFYKHLPAMRSDGAILYEIRGRPPQRRLWTLVNILERWLVIQAQNGKIF